MQDTILAISGKPGLYRLISQGRGMLIVETVGADKKRLPAGARDRVTSLNDVSMYTNEDDKPLMEIFQSIADKENGQPTSIDYKKPASRSWQTSWPACCPITTVTVCTTLTLRNSFSGTTFS